MNLLKGGIQHADKITTVSPTYAQEIRTEQFGHGLQGSLTYRGADLLGILNGIDEASWDPQKIRLSPAPSILILLNQEKKPTRNPCLRK